MRTEHDRESAKVEEFGQRLHADPAKSVKLAQALLLGPPNNNDEAATQYVDFELTLSPWEQAAVVDELRDAIDKQLGVVFEHYVARAREDEASTHRVIQPQGG